MSDAKKPSRSSLPVPDADAPAIQQLIAVMAALRDPDGGCPWDIEQTSESIAPYTIEEAYEVAEAISRGDLTALKDELGDLLLQVVYHGRIAEESGAFDFNDIAAGITAKMIRRHPHVFDDTVIDGDAAQTQAWEVQKANERAAKAAADGRQPGTLDGVSAAYPALMRAIKLQRRAARVGFDWPTIEPVVDKITEELGEVMAELAVPHNIDQDAVEAEMGDLLFACVNFARHLNIDPETALRRTNGKFEARFGKVERLLAEELGHGPEAANLEQMEERWQRSKRG
jgi:ATP diphosphatase